MSVEILKFICVFACLNVIILDAAKILCVFPTPAYSHQGVFRRFTKELAKRGHEVVAITPLPNNEGDKLENLKEVNIYNESYYLWRGSVASQYGKEEYIRTRYKNVLITQINITENMLKSTKVRKILSDESNFDLLVLEGLSRPIRSFAHIFKAPVIAFTSLMSCTDENQLSGSPIHPTLYPLMFQQRLESNTILGQIAQLYLRFLAYNTLSKLENDENEMLRRYFSDIPSLSELINNIVMVFMNVNPVWELNRPVPPSVVYGGAMHMESEKDLPKDLEIYLNSSVHGVIYVSFGTNMVASALPSAGMQVMVRVLSSLPYDVLWKWDEDELYGRGTNIKLAKWLPQADLLRHPKIKLFITQCGLQSTDEAIDAGVPLIGIPMVADQWYNAENYIKHTIGAKIEMDTITEEEFKDAIKTVIGDERYRKNIKRFGALLRDSRQTPMERIMWWTEYVLRHGALHVRAPAHNMHWTEYLEIELLGICLLFVFLCFIFFFTCLYYLINFTSNIIRLGIYRTGYRNKYRIQESTHTRCC